MDENTWLKFERDAGDGGDVMRVSPIPLGADPPKLFFGISNAGDLEGESTFSLNRSQVVALYQFMFQWIQEYPECEQS